jgi:hypothetical protein
MPAGGHSPYRERAAPAKQRARRDHFTLVVMLAVLGCSLARFALFAFGAERLGVDPVLALAASVASAYYLVRHVER